MLSSDEPTFSVECLGGSIKSILATSRCPHRDLRTPVVVFTYDVRGGRVCVRGAPSFIHAFLREAAPREVYLCLRVERADEGEEAHAVILHVLEDSVLQSDFDLRV